MSNFTKLNNSVNEYGGNNKIWCKEIKNQQSLK